MIWFTCETCSAEYSSASAALACEMEDDDARPRD